jgi:hypothetical protein
MKRLRKNIDYYIITKQMSIYRKKRKSLPIICPQFIKKELNETLNNLQLS